MSVPKPMHATINAGPASGSVHATYAWMVFGVALCLAALVAIGFDLATLSGAGRYEAITPGRIWFQTHVGSLNLVQAIVQRYVHPGLWDPLMVTALRWPLWSLVGGLGVIALTLSLPRRR